MIKLCINLRHELRIIPLDSVVAVRAGGNYSDFFFTDGTVRTELSCLSVFASQITSTYAAAETPCPFFRLGRSLIVNTDYVESVNLRTRRVTFSTSSVQAVTASTDSLRELKELMSKRF